MDLRRGAAPAEAWPSFAHLHRLQRARALGLDRHGVAIPALEAGVSRAASGQWPEGEAWIDHGTVPMGYAWILPRGDQLSVGISGLVAGDALREALRDFVRLHRQDVPEVIS